MRTFSCLMAAALVLLGCAPAGAQTADPQRRADIERLIELTGAVAMGQQMSTIASKQIMEGMRSAQPNIPERVFTIVQEVFAVEFPKMFAGPESIMPEMVDLYGRAFTSEEVQALIAFYSTPTGRKVVAVMPMLAQEGAIIGQRWASANMQRIMGIVQDRVRAEKVLP